MVSMEESSELLATYAGLGTHDGTKYYRGDECLACVKDLIRALRSDDSRCEIRRQLGQAGILQKDLLPILVTSSDNSVLCNDVIRLLVNLTQPAYLCFGGSYPRNKDSDLMKCFLEVNRYLRGYKESFALEDVMNTLGTVLADLCQKEWEERDDDDIIVIERILLLIRNILHISPEVEEEKRTDDDVSVHDQIIWNLHINGIDELLLFLGSNQTESQWCMHVLEIMFLMMREQSPEILAKTGKDRTASELRKEEELVEEALATEHARRHKSQRLCGSRHPSFGGTFVVKNQKSISGSNRVYHRRLSGVNDHSYDVEKRPRRTPKTHRPAKDLPKERRSTYSIRTVLKNICIQFLECCYNPLMKVVKDNIMHQRAMDNDETYYLWCLRFFMEFSRLHDFRVDIVGETLQLSTLHYIIQLMANYFESMVVEKKSHVDARQWAQRLHYAVQAYKELLLYIQEMSLSKAEHENSKVMQSNVFYHPEYRDIFVTLLRNFFEVFQTTSSLRDVVECTHVYVRMMERYCSENKHLVVRETKKRSKKKGKSKRKGGPPKMLSEDQLVDLWERIDARVAELCEGVEPLPAPPIPFDSASDVPLEEQKLDAMGRVKSLLIDALHPEAIALIRAAREVWPDDVFGCHGISSDDETEVVRSILLNPSAVMPASRFLGNEEDGDESEDGNDEGGAVEVTNVEMEFSIRSYIERFANNKIIRSYCLVLRDYRKNSESVNHAIVKMLFRVAFQLKMAPLLYQISVFRTLQSILEEPNSPRFKELQKFARHIVSGFLAMTTKNPLMFVELLFWKTSQDCYELTAGYGTREREKELRQLSATWTLEQEKELEELFNQYKDEEDVVACIEAGLDGGIPRSRKQIAKQLVTQGLVSSRKELHKKGNKPAKGVWSEEELARLHEMFSCESGGDMRGMMEFFPGRGIRDITAQLKMLGLLPEKKKYSLPKLAQVSDTSDSESESGRIEPRQKRKATGEGSLGRLVSRLHTEGYSDQLSWLEAYLSDEARDRRMDDEWEDLCVVAVSESIAKALRTKDFQQLLTLLKLQPPSQQEVYWRIPSTMTPQELEEAAKSLHNDPSCHSNKRIFDGDQVNGYRSSEGEDSPWADQELTKAEALSELLRSKGKSPLDEGEPLTTTALVHKRPRLTRRGSFFDDSDSDIEPERARRISTKQNGRPDRSSLVDIEDSRSSDQSSSHLKRPLKGGHFDSSASDSENELTFKKETEKEVANKADVMESGRKRGRYIQDSSDDSANEGAGSGSHGGHAKPVKKVPKLVGSDSESEDELIIDLETCGIQSPPMNTIDLSSGDIEGGEECGNYGNQPGSMETLAVSQSIVS